MLTAEMWHMRERSQDGTKICGLSNRKNGVATTEKEKTAGESGLGERGIISSTE